jgi:hypothetical protein
VYVFRPFWFNEKEAIDRAIQLSLSLEQHRDDMEPEQVIHSVPEEMSNDQFTELLRNYANQQISGPPRSMVVSRASLWSTAAPYFKRKRFTEGKGMIQVTFATFEEEEDAVDLGGPRREFLHLLVGAICKESKTLTGTSN